MLYWRIVIMEEDTNILEKVSSDIEQQIQMVYENSSNRNYLSRENVDYLYKLEDIHKDIANEFYWKEKEDNMRYMGRGQSMDSYRRRARDSRGRYTTHDSYDRPYRGEEHLMDMQDHYRGYYTDREKYGADNATLDSLAAMLDSGKNFFKMLMRDAKSQEEVEMIKETAKEVAEM